MPRRRLDVLGLALLAATLLVYQPAWFGGILWDDEGHLTRAELAGADGLRRIWLEPGATQQYYPVTHSAFWLFHRLWGHATPGYHLVNIALHAASAFLLLIILRRLEVPGALLAAAVFALHPVHVESVAWMTELKNVLSGFFYLSAALAYLRFDRTRAPRAYVAACLLFALAVLSKTVTVTLPAVLLILFWWQRGEIRWREDVRPLVPLFVFGAAAGLVTIWAERTLIGARGAEFDLTFVQRALLAGRTICFYAGKLLWPADLLFIYPRWRIDPSAWTQWLFPAAVSAAACLGWLTRRRTRAPLAVLLFFCVTLLPASGFFDVYPFRFSFVADHFQYLASIGVIAGLASVLTLAVRRDGVPRMLAHAGAAALLVMLGALTWRQAHLYADAETLYRVTIDRNPSAWLARNNLAALLLAGDPTPGRIQEATAHLDRAIQLKADYAEARYNLGTALERVGRHDEAIAQYMEVLRLDPGQPRALQRLAAIRHDRASALLEGGLVDEEADRYVEAERAYREAAALDPSRAVTHRFIGRVLQKQGRRDDAIAAYRQALALDGASFETHNDLGVLLAQAGQLDEALARFEAAVRLRPDDPGARANLAQARALLDRRSSR